VLLFVAVTVGEGQGLAVASVNFYLGDVNIKKAGKEEWGSVALKQELFTGDAVRTGARSRLELKLDEKDVVRIDENSELEVSKTVLAQFRGTESKANLKRGKIWTNVRRAVADRENLSVETPTVVAAIHGTVFRIDIPTLASTVLRVYEGEVEAGENPVQPVEQPIAGPPREIPPPAEVSVQEWLQIVAANQQLMFTRGAEPEVTAFDAAADSALDWVQWNRNRDAALPPSDGSIEHRRGNR
jgi:hypothetical protein